MRAVLYALTATLVLATALYLIGQNAERFLNRVEPHVLPLVSDHARSLHHASFVLDMHADTALMGRDLLELSEFGHVDLPRLVQGGVGLQFFTIPTKVPYSRDIHTTRESDPDVLRLLGTLRWGPLRRTDLFRRAMVQVAEVRHAVERSDGELVAIRTRKDLEALLDARANGESRVGSLLGLEGAHALDGDFENLTRFHVAGVRMIGLTHFFDNGFAGSAHGVTKGGLTLVGRELVKRMVDLGIMIDLAHLSPTAIDDVLGLVDVPTVVSHTGVKGTCDNPRNLSDDHVRAIAAGGGVIGIGFFRMAVCGTGPDDIVAAMLHVIKLVGADHVALGSDFDGGVTTAFDVSQLASVTQAMVDAKLSDEEIVKILGGNTVRVMRQVLPEA
jgi:membrane dipeptidase